MRATGAQRLQPIGSHDNRLLSGHRPFLSSAATPGEGESAAPVTVRATFGFAAAQGVIERKGGECRKKPSRKSDTSDSYEDLLDLIGSMPRFLP